MPATRYRLDTRIGAGGMAEVFRATTEGTQGFERPVAIKRVLPARSASPHFAEMFVNEARIMATLRHPNVVAVSDFARDDEGRLLLVMELVEGVTLKRLTRTGPVPFPVAIYIATELLRGLGHMHGCKDEAGNPLGLVHRDLSANNVLLSWDGAVKLSDFGLAKAYAGKIDGDSAAYGTPQYMSPEQVGGGTIDQRTDLFAVGIVLYELLTGTVPFVGANRALLDFAVLHQPVEPPSMRRPGVPADLEAITMQLLERERMRRPASADAVIDALDRCEAASHLARKELTTLLQERFPGSGAQGDSDLEALRITERKSMSNRLPPAIWIEFSKGHAPEAAMRQASVVRQASIVEVPMAVEMPVEQAPAPAPATIRTGARWAWAAALLLVLGSVAIAIMLRRDAGPPTQTATMQTATPMHGTQAIIEPDDTNRPRAASATDISRGPGQAETAPAVERDRASADSDSRAARTRMDRVRPGGSFPYFFAEGARR